MNESYVTLQGWVGADVEVRAVGESRCASFRVACTPRFLRAGSWVDGETSWHTVDCWRALGRNVSESVRGGDAVIVHGRVRSDTWTRDDGTTVVSLVVDATYVGHDLTRGTSAFTKTARSRPADTPGDEVAGEAVPDGGTPAPEAVAGPVAPAA